MCLCLLLLCDLPVERGYLLSVFENSYFVDYVSDKKERVADCFLSRSEMAIYSGEDDSFEQN